MNASRGCRRMAGAACCTCAASSARRWHIRGGSGRGAGSRAPGSGLGGAACLQGDAAVADARAFLELVDRLDAAGRFSLEELERETARLHAAPDAAAGEALQFMTIHKAKGLEFETVIVPGLHRAVGGGAGSGEQRLMRWEEVAFAGTDERLVAAPIRGKGNGNGDGATLHDYLRLLERERAANEDQRTLYVAATRAIRALHLVGVARPRADGTLAVPAASFLELLWSGLSAEFDAAPVHEAVADDGAAAQFEPRLLRVAEPAIAALFQGGTAVEPLPTPMVPTAAGEDGGGGGDAALAADVGTLVHAYLEMIAGDGLASWPLSRVEALAPAMRAWLGQQGHAEAAVRRGAREAQDALKATLESAAGRWVLGVQCEATAEWALSVADGEAIATQVIDRSFVADGSRWIIDYKTAKVGSGIALRQHAERYREQLERYAALFRVRRLADPHRHPLCGCRRADRTGAAQARSARQAQTN